MRYELDSSDTRWGPVAGCCEHRNEPLGSIKDGGFHDRLSDCNLLEKGSAIWSSSGLYQQ
jgi:hypothetical protein